MQKNQPLDHQEYGFTLIELMIVVAIIGILGSIAVGLYGQQRMKSYNASAASDLKNITTFETMFYNEYLEYAPVSLADMQASGIIIATTTLNTGKTATLRISSLNKDMSVIVKTANGNHTALVAVKHAASNIMLASDFDALSVKNKSHQGSFSVADLPTPTNNDDLASWAPFL